MLHMRMRCIHIYVPIYTHICIYTCMDVTNENDRYMNGSCMIWMTYVNREEVIIIKAYWSGPVTPKQDTLVISYESCVTQKRSAR